MMYWYLLPTILVALVTVTLNAGFVWALGLILLAGPVAYFGGRWEINNWYLPKKRELESLRELLLQADEKSGSLIDNLIRRNEVRKGQRR